MIRPVLEYGSPTWSPHHKKEINQLESVQRRCFKIADGAISLPSLESRRKAIDLHETYKFTHNLYRTDVSKFFTPSANVQTRGHQYKLEKTFSRTDTRKFFFSNRVITPWNQLPENVVSAPSLSTFKKRLRGQQPDAGAD